MNNFNDHERRFHNIQISSKIMRNRAETSKILQRSHQRTPDIIQISLMIMRERSKIFKNHEGTCRDARIYLKIMKENSMTSKIL